LRAAVACFVEQEQVLLPMLELVEDATTSIDEPMNRPPSEPATTNGTPPLHPMNQSG